MTEKKFCTVQLSIETHAKLQEIQKKFTVDRLDPPGLKKLAGNAIDDYYSKVIVDGEPA